MELDVAKKNEEESNVRGEEIAEEDVSPKPKHVINEDPFLKAIKS